MDGVVRGTASRQHGGSGAHHGRHRSASPRDHLLHSEASPGFESPDRRSRSRSRERFLGRDHELEHGSPRSCLPQDGALIQALTLPVLQGVPVGEETPSGDVLLGVPVFPAEPDMATFHDEVEAAWGEPTRADPFLLELEALSS